GANARRRYYELYDDQSTLPLLSSGYERIGDTDRKLGEGFLQWNYTSLGAINIIQETADQGANSLVPSCNANVTTQTKCSYPKNSTESGAPWLYSQYETAAYRLNEENPGINLNKSDIPHLIAVAAFELNVRGSSPWVDVFTAEEWNAFEYAQSSYYYCFYGP
ncbi:histidine-type phosphatase, partial [Macrococcus caseolyticus]